ncbi:PP2C family protein-serine/threonine phosphatase [Leptonema illini]|uniref:Protein serine/threonine phosphatase n=1 Tax=Leptonema illini DSM 21528 TaxID=929563 RepID=H2CC66_9LEPT|nr:PP2C family protein-serine/threonine phosphatase [Leptonema illini]EHQ05295.1 protein serine/threonine phosphatase [Leptonema illini DSM 21528]
MNFRDKLYRAGMRYLDAYLPEDHPILRESRSRRRLRILMGVGTVFNLILISKLPVVFLAGGVRLLLFVSMIAVFTTGLAWVLFMKAKGVDYVTAAFIGLGALHNIIDAYTYPIFPPRNLPFFFMILLSAHLLFGRWYSLAILFVMSVAYVPLINVPSLDGVVIIDPRVMDYRINIATNTIIAGLMVWLISEAYDYFRESSERQLKDLNREREKDLELAARVQQDLVPQMSRIGSYRIDSVSRPAAVVGGDYHEALRAGTANWFAIGDVSGHGLQAGMLSMQVRSMLAYLLMELGLDKPSDVLVELNNSFHQVVRKLNIRSYMTFLLARIDDQGRLSFTGSHQKLVLLRRRRGEIEIVPSHGIWLGLEHIEDRRRIMEFELMMEVDDILFLFTDGLTEARNEKGELYGFDRLIGQLQRLIEGQEELTEKALTDHIVKDFDHFRGSIPCEDDVTVFCIRRVTDQDL